MDVALSMHSRETENFRIGMALRVWYVYNRRAIEQSADLCRVVSSHHSLMADPVKELGYIHKSLVDRCHVPLPSRVATADIKDFVDVKLQHGNTPELNTICNTKIDYSNLYPPPVWPTTDSMHLNLYRSCIRAFCALEDRSIFKPDFKWDDKINDGE